MAGVRCVRVSGKLGALILPPYQAGVLAAGALAALQHVLPRIMDGTDHSTARTLAEALAEVEITGLGETTHPFEIDLRAIESNMFILVIPAALRDDFDQDEFIGDLLVRRPQTQRRLAGSAMTARAVQKHKVAVIPRKPGEFRIVTHHQINEADVPEVRSALSRNRTHGPRVQIVAAFEHAAYTAFA